MRVWQKASEVLKEAKYIYIIGYSLPASDNFFKYFFALSTINPKSDIRAIRVFNPDANEAIRNRYIKIIGQETSNVFQYWPSKFGDCIIDNGIVGFKEQNRKGDYYDAHGNTHTNGYL